MNPIGHFVRDTLGCRCPDEVFRSISIDHLYAADGATPYTRLIVGNRLLIYVLEAESTSVARGALADLAARGCRERDDRDYHRFRLVITCDDREPASAAARHAFDQAAGDDQRAHLHCLSRALLPAEVAPRPPEDVVLATIGVAGRTLGSTR